MAKLLEKDIQKAVKDYLTYRGIFCWKQNNAGIKKLDGGYIPSGMVGVSDILGIYKGRMLAIEVKNKGNKPSPAQKEFLDNVNHHGGIGFVAYNLEDVIENLKKF